MKLSISQPTLFPWLGFFSIIKNSDAFVFLDNVKFEKRGWQMRNRLKTITDENELWINIPTTLDKSSTLITDVIIDNSQKWQKKHLSTFQRLYGDSYHEIKFLKEFYDQKWEKLNEFNIEFITKCCNFLKIDTPLYRASKFNVDGKKSELLLNICKKFNATEYISTIGSKEYLDEELFKQANIPIIYYEYEHPTYKQKGKIFLEKMSILDLLFNEKNNSSKVF